VNREPIYDEVVARNLFAPDQPPDATQALPIVEATQEHGGTVKYAGHQDHALPLPGRLGQDDLTHGDHLASPTWNGLYPEDLELAQPPQDPDWRPDADG
jgi:hypothetical protein